MVSIYIKIFLCLILFPTYSWAIPSPTSLPTEHELLVKIEDTLLLYAEVEALITSEWVIPHTNNYSIYTFIFITLLLTLLFSDKLLKYIRKKNK
jgi:hypothetical protein